MKYYPTPRTGDACRLILEKHTKVDKNVTTSYKLAFKDLKQFCRKLEIEICQLKENA